MNKVTRIGLVEVGSSTIRYLVADFADDMSFVPDKIETTPHDLDPVAPTAEAVGRLNLKVEEHVEDAKGRGCDAFLAFGTASCRNAELLYPGKLTRLLRVLSPAEEAMAAWVAGFLCSPNGLQVENTCTVIDHGSGSTEIVRATWSGKTISNIAFYSSNIGSTELAKRYRSHRSEHIKLSAELVGGVDRELKRLRVCEGQLGDVYLVGGVATRLGWCLSGKSPNHYRPEEVNGVRVTKDHLHRFYLELSREYLKDPARARLLVDSRKGGEEQALRLLGSTPFLMLLANRLDQRGEYFVSAYTVRHGIAFLIKHELLAYGVPEPSSLVTPSIAAVVNKAG